MPRGLTTALWIIWLVVVCFLSFVAHAIAFKDGGIEWLAILLGIFWLIYLAGLWLEQSRISDIAWTMLLGYAIGCIRMLDMIPNQQEYAHWLRFIPKSIIGLVVLAFIVIFVGVLPLIARNIIESHKEKNRILGRDA